MDNLLTKSRNIRGIKLGKFSFVISSTGLVVSKEGNPFHLTICFNIQKKKLDIHLKNEMNKFYETIFTISHDDLIRFTEETTPENIQFFRKTLKLVRPGWLRKHRYYISYSTESEFIEAFKKHSLTIKSKYHPKIPEMINHFLIEREMYYPSILHELIHDEKIEYVFASKLRNCKNELIIFKLLNWGKTQWYSVSRNTIQEFMKGFWSSEIKSIVITKMQRINQLMKFDEIEDLFKLDKKSMIK